MIGCSIALSIGWDRATWVQDRCTGMDSLVQLRAEAGCVKSDKELLYHLLARTSAELRQANMMVWGNSSCWLVQFRSIMDGALIFGTEIPTPMQIGLQFFCPFLRVTDAKSRILT